MIRTRQNSTYAVSALLGLGLVIAARMPLAVADGRFFAWGAVAVLVTSAVALQGVHCFRGGGIWRSVRLTAPAILLSVSAFLYLLIIETSWGLYGLAALAMLLTALFFDNLRRPQAGTDSSHPADLVHVSFVLDAVSLFFLLAFIFGFGTFYYVSLPLAALGVGLVTALMTHETLWRAGFGTRAHASLVAAAGVIGMEAYAALSLLPTSYLVNAAVAVVLLSAALHVARQILAGAGEFKYFRKELAVSLLLAALLLTTARWA